MIRIRRNEPARLDETDLLRGTWLECVKRAWILAHRASFQVNGEHSIVWVSVEGLSKSGDWVTVWQCQTRCKKGATPK